MLAGTRVFRIGDEQIRVEAGECIHIPARIVHRSLPSADDDVRCLNIYALLPAFGPTLRVLSAPQLKLLAGEAEPKELLSAVLDHLARTAGEPDQAAATTSLPQSADEIALRRGLARESYIRNFSRRFDMPPYAYALVERLNEARDRLRSGDAIAAVAADTGFADQSHFGRHFLRVFGATPRAYRDGGG